MTKVTFETATFADVVKKASKIAPTKGNAFDKAAGIVIEIDPSSSSVVVRATDLNIFSMEWVNYLEIEGEATTWRVPSQLFAQVVGSLPIGSGKTVVLENKLDKRNHEHLSLTSGRTKAQFNLMETDHYPPWYPFDPTNLIKAENLGGRIAQVEWAAAKSASTPQLEGVHFDGECCVATDSYRLARAELRIPDLDTPVTVPAGILGQILKQTGEVMIGVDENQLLIMPDESTQIRAILYAGEYPHVAKIMRRDQPNVIKVRKAPLMDILSRAANFAGNDRFPALKLFIGREEIAVMMENQEIGLLGDVCDVTGYATHPRREIVFTSKNLVDSIGACPNDEIEIRYDESQMHKIMYINGGSGFEAWVIPRQPGAVNG